MEETKDYGSMGNDDLGHLMKGDAMANALAQVGILEPQYRVGKIQGQVIKADSAAKSLIPPKILETSEAAEAKVEGEAQVQA